MNNDNLNELQDANELSEEVIPSKGNNAPDGEDKNTKGGFVSTVFENVETITIAICVALLIISLMFRLCTVVGTSMCNTLQNGDRLIVSNFFYTPERGDIIVFHQTGDTYNEPLVKRVIATEGEWVDVEFGTWKVRIADNPEMKNAVTLEEPYVFLDGAYYGSIIEFPVQVPEGHVFVMGDNRNNSADSRSPKVGFVDTRRILGKVLFRLYPFAKIEN